MSTEPEPIDTPATASGDLDDDQDVVAAQQRDADPDGDPDALDPGDLNEAPTGVDPPEADQINPDAGDPLDDVEHGEDDGVEDYSQAEDDEDDEDPEVELDDDPAGD